MELAIKGFDANLKCRGFQFEIGRTYTHEGSVEACKSGFHAIPSDVHPLTVFSFYPPANSRFCVVEVGGETDRESDKIAAKILTVQKEIGLNDLATASVNWVMSRATHEGNVATKKNGAATASGPRGAATASGEQGAATASGEQGAATASGEQGAATASGYQGAATASGYQGAATASGTRGAATASGEHSVATVSGWMGGVKAREGSALFAVERNDDGSIASVACGISGQGGIRPDTWYRCEGGNLVEVTR
jgi:hypothetical protein